MTIILIFIIIITLVVMNINNNNQTIDNIYKNNLIQQDIKNNFYKEDTKLNNFLTYCSMETLTTKDLNNTVYENNCFKLFDPLKNNNINISNSNSGIYNICYNYNYNDFNSSYINKDKNVTQNNSQTCVQKLYNNSLPLEILKEIEGFFTGNNKLNSITLQYYNTDGTRKHTFTYNSKTYSKDNYY